jgi:hypothetical protein
MFFMAPGDLKPPLRLNVREYIEVDLSISQFSITVIKYLK